jgi:hypothetical protein
MRNVITADDLDVVNNQKVKAYCNSRRKSDDYVENSPVFEILTTEGSESFSRYIEDRGLSNEQDIIILSSQHHYYYDAEEMRNVRTVINLKELNRIREVKKFLRSIFQLLPKNSNFVGCFVDNRKLNVLEIRNNSSSSQKKADYHDLKENSIFSNSPFINMIYNFMDSRINKHLSAMSVAEMLGESGFMVLDMTEIYGLTYFHSQKTENTDE